jgi:UDPglucose 6-dehydrogenase
MIGVGYVGLVSGACFSEFGHDVVCIDSDAGRISALQRGEIPIYEPGLEELVARNRTAGRLRFTTDLGDALQDAEAVFIAVGTPSRRGDGHADLTYVYHAAREIAAEIDGYTVVVTKSTVPVGTGREVARIIRDVFPGAEFDVASNPEFLREGSAIGDFMRPDRIVIGAESERAREVLRRLYRPLSLRDTPILFADLETAELIKYAANAFLALKISYINQISDLCEKVGADVQDVARGIGLDGRIGPKFLHPGPGYGGSCFPKDTQALMHTAQAAGAPLSLVEATIAYNDARKSAMADRVLRLLDGDARGQRVAVLGLTFKPNTDDMREAPSLTILPRLQAAGVVVSAHDPVGMAEARRLMPDIRYCDDAYQAIEGADALVLLTEWNAYRGMDLQRMRALMRRPLVIDLRNVYRSREMRKAGFVYHSLGRPKWR